MTMLGSGKFFWWSPGSGRSLRLSQRNGCQDEPRRPACVCICTFRLFLQRPPATEIAEFSSIDQRRCDSRFPYTCIFQASASLGAITSAAHGRVHTKIRNASNRRWRTGARAVRSLAPSFGTTPQPPSLLRTHGGATVGPEH